MIDDSKQRNQALDITKSFIVQAPAGSGKTEILTQRYLKLLAVSKNPESIVALTFTNKAVAELKSRIMDSLLMKKPDLEHKKLTFDLAQKVLKQDIKYNWNLLHNHHRISVLTLDSLAAKITHNYPSEDNFATQSMLENFIASEFYTDSAKQVLLKIDEEKCVQELLQHLDNSSNNFIKLVAKMLSFRDKWITKVFDSSSINLESINNCINSINKEYIDTIYPLAVDNFGNSFFNLCSFNPKLAQFEKIPQTTLEWQNLSELLLTKTGNIRKSVAGFDKKNKDIKVLFNDIIHSFSSNFIKLLASAIALPRIDEDSHTLQNIVKVLMIANSELQDLFFKNNKTDFIEVMLKANNALNTDDKISDISLLLDYKIEHILLDEFQDTSYTQLDLITNIVKHWELESGRTLFVVGDPMQSIYLFRGAQVGVFLQSQEFGIADIKLENITLTQNFRSTKNIVEENNKIFSNIFPELDNINSGAICFAKSSSNADKKGTAISIYPFLPNQEELEVKQILKIINDNIDKEVAILCRSRNHSIEIIKTLELAKVKFEAVKNTKLIANIFTQDLLNIVKILLNPNDRLAWFCILRNPWCGLKLDDILEISQGDIWQNLANHNLELIDKNRVKQIWQIFNTAFVNLGSFSLVNILVSVADSLGITANLDSLEKIIFDKFNNIIAKCEDLNKLEITIIEKYLEDLYSPAINSNIKIMTIHQSKGLEFDVIIVPSIGKSPKAKDRELIYLSEFKNHGMLLAALPYQNSGQNYEYLHSVEKSREYYESIRLLYVTLTRAKSQVHLLGSVNNKLKPKKNSFLELLWGQYSHFWQGFTTSDILDNQELEVATIWQRQANIPVLKTPDIDRTEVGGVLFDDGLNAKIIGLVVHKLLQLENFNIAKNKFEKYLLSYGISPNYLLNSVDIVDSMLEKTKNSVDFEFIFKYRASTLVEAEFIENNKIMIVDRLFIEDGILWIIDYKTNIFNNEISLESFINQQKRQHSKQLKNYQNILKNVYSQTIKTAIFLTDIGRMVVL